MKYTRLVYSRRCVRLIPGGFRWDWSLAMSKACRTNRGFCLRTCTETGRTLDRQCISKWCCVSVSTAIRFNDEAKLKTLQLCNPQKTSLTFHSRTSTVFNFLQNRTTWSSSVTRLRIVFKLYFIVFNWRFRRLNLWFKISWEMYLNLLFTKRTLFAKNK